MSEDNVESGPRGFLHGAGMLCATVIGPMALLSIAEANYPELEVGTNRALWIGIGCALAVLAFVEGYNRKGSSERMFAGILGVGGMLAWMAALLGGTKFKATIFGFEVDIDATRLAMLVVAGMCLKVVYYVTEQRAYRYKGEAEQHYSDDVIVTQSYTPRAHVERSASYAPPKAEPRPQPTTMIKQRSAVIRCNKCGYRFAIMRDPRPGMTKITCPKCGHSGVM